MGRGRENGLPAICTLRPILSRLRVLRGFVVFFPSCLHTCGAVSSQALPDGGRAPRWVAGDGRGSRGHRRARADRGACPCRMAMAEEVRLVRALQRSLVYKPRIVLLGLELREKRIVKAAITDGQGKVWIEDVPVPDPGDYQCLCKMEACATCTGTDQKHIHGKLPFACEYPGVLGHESVGIVTEVGPKVRHLSKGDRVLRPAAVYPGEKLGRWSSCWGGFAEYGIVADRKAALEDNPEAALNNYTRFQLPVPHDLHLSAAECTMLVTLKECASVVAATGTGLLRSAAVLGAGSVGISMIRFAKIFGAWPVIAVARRDEQLAYAKDPIGADFTVNVNTADAVARIRSLTDGRGVDRIIDTTGNSALLRSMLPALADDGKAVPYATYESADAAQDAVPEDKRIPALSSEDGAHAYMLDAVRMGLVDLEAFYSHTMPLDQIVEGFAMIERKEAFKIVFEM